MWSVCPKLVLVYTAELHYTQAQRHESACTIKPFILPLKKLVIRIPACAQGYSILFILSLYKLNIC